MSALRCAYGHSVFEVNLPDGIVPTSPDWVTYQLGEESLLSCANCGRSPMDAIEEQA